MEEEEVGNDQVEALAAALAPQVRELESLMDDPLLKSSSDNLLSAKSSSVSLPSKIVSEDDDVAKVSDSNHERNRHTTASDDRSNSNSNDSDYDFHMDVDDDDMDNEIDQLAFSEDMLRQELNLAEDFASFFGSSPLAMAAGAADASSSLNLNLNFNLSSLTPATLFQSEPEPPPPAALATLPTGTVPELSPAPVLETIIAATEKGTPQGMDDEISNKTPPSPMPGLPVPAPQCEVDADEDQDQELQQEEDAQDLEHASPFDPRDHTKMSPQPHRHALRLDSFAQVSPLRSSASATIEPATEPQTAENMSTPLSKKGQENSNVDTCGNSGNHSTSQFKTPTPRRQKTPSSDHPETPQTSIVLYKSPAKSYTSTEHFERLQLRKEPQGAWYSVDLTTHLVNLGGPAAMSHVSSISDQEETGVSLATAAAGLGMKEYCLSICQWKRLFVGLRLEEDEEKQQLRKQKKQQRKQQEAQSAKQAQEDLPQTPQAKSPANEPPKKAPARTVSIRIRPDVLCGAVMDAVTQALMNCPQSSIVKRQGGHLQATVTGMASVVPSISSSISKRRSSSSSSRECTFLVDAQLCTHKSGQCERVLLLRIYHCVAGAEEEDLWSPSSARTSTSTAAGASPTVGMTANGTQDHDDCFLIIEEDASTTSLAAAKDQQANLHLREACALIQRIESPELARKIRPLVRKSQSSPDTNIFGLRVVVSEHLHQNYRACPSVLQPDTTITLPSLSPQDWPVIQASWAWIHSVWDELETRELTYISLLDLSTSMAAMSPSTPSNEDQQTTLVPRFGVFPALPTLDVQYCSQLRRLSREAMIGQLLKAASVLEEYARQAEYQCANLIDLLRPTFAHYGAQNPSLPKPAPLATYPLEYTPPQALCPPWGMKVTEALNQVAAMSHAASQTTDTSLLSSPASPSMFTPNTGANDGLSRSLESIALAETAVQMIYEAFQQQDDEEQSARLARKNLQVMDRLAKMQEHNRASIKALALSVTDNAVAAGDAFFSKAEHAIIGLTAQLPPSEQGPDKDIHTKPWREIPLLKWTMGVGGSSGTCTITASQLQFTPAKYIPLIGQSQSTWFCLRDVEFSVSQSQPTLLNPLSTTIHVLERSSGVEVYSFKPSSSAPRLKSFLDIAQKESMEAR